MGIMLVIDIHTAIRPRPPSLPLSQNLFVIHPFIQPSFFRPSPSLPPLPPPSFSGKGYAVAFDPLDGASVIDTNFAVGTIWSIYQGRTQLYTVSIHTMNTVETTLSTHAMITLCVSTLESMCYCINFLH